MTLKNILSKLLKEWLFPDFSNKLTWTIVTTGLAKFAAPNIFKLYIYNRFIDITGANNGIHLT